MSVSAHRATFLAAGTALLALTSAPAAAQVDQGIAINILIECAKIEDPTARLACYDNNIRQLGGAPRTSLPGRMPTPQGGGAPVAASPGGFGGESVRVQQPPQPQQARSETPTADEVNAQVTSVTQTGPGTFRLTLQDGAVWETQDTVGTGYRTPRRGSTVTLMRAAMGSFLMRFDNQQSVRIRRVR